MSTPIDEILNRVRENLADKKRREQESQAISDECQANLSADILSLALDFVPDFMRPFATIENMNNSKWRVIFALPECALISREIRAIERDEDENLKSLDMYRTYQVARWLVYDDEIVPDWHYIEKFEDLNQALMSALELGDNHAECEQRIIQHEQRWKASQAEAEARKNLPYCPLKYGHPRFDDDPYCDTVKCAWFISFKRQDACALKVIAHAQTEFMASE